MALISISSGIIFRVYQTLNTNSDDILVSIKGKIDINNPSYTALRDQGKFNILIMGEDNVDGSRRSDTILFVTIDIDDKNVKVISLPRDTRVSIPRHGMQKLNHAFAYGGQDLLKATVENYLSQPILYYVIVDYDSFPAVVDAFGGVEVNVEKHMRYVDKAGKLDININPGLQTFNGINALHYVRFRKDALGDIGRVQRQQNFLKALLKKVYEPSTLIKIPEITTNLMKLFKTDMSPTLAIQLAGFVKNELKRENIYFYTLKGEPALIDKLSYWIGDVQDIKEFINADMSLSKSAPAHDNGEKNNNMSSNNSSSNMNNSKNIPSKKETINIIKSMKKPVAVLNGTGASSIGTTFSSLLQNIGIDVIHVGNAKHFDYKFSNIVYPINSDNETIDTAKKMGKLLNISPSLIRAGKQAEYVSLIIGQDSNELKIYLETILNTK
ncbi:MAG: LCP family protein [Synergistaceae bacterium]